MKEFTPGPWVKGKDGQSIVSTADTDVKGNFFADNLDKDNIEYYGGVLVCESVCGPDADLICAAPTMVQACKTVLSEFRRLDLECVCGASPVCMICTLEQAIVKAESE